MLNAAESPLPACQRTAPWWQRYRARTAFYALVLVGLSVPVYFARLGDGMLVCDEAAFAMTTDYMLETGDWVVPTIDGTHPHLNAAPLYNWLSCLTAGATSDTPFRYRLWSAVFGVLCTLAVLLLGTELFQPEIGFLAAVFLLINQTYLVEHGPRDGVMESGLMTFHTLMIFFYARANRDESKAAYWWVMAGLALGGAVLIKPPAFGGFFFILLLGHHLVWRTDLPLALRLGRPLLGLVAAGLVSLPWYGMVFHRLGCDGLKQLFIFNSIDRALENHQGDAHQGFWQALDGFQHSARTARMFGPALAIGLVFALSSAYRFGCGLLAYMAGIFLTAISCMATRHYHYYYNALPALYVLSVAVLLVGLSRRPLLLGQGALAVWSWRTLAATGILAAAFLVQNDCRRTWRYWQRPRSEYPPLEVYRAIQPRLASGQAHLVLFRFPRPGLPIEEQLETGGWWEDQFYFKRIEKAELMEDIGPLNRLLAEGKPTVVFASARYQLEDLQKAGLGWKPDRTFRVTEHHSAVLTVITFNGAERELGLQDYFQSVERP